MLIGQKHLIQCRCILHQFKKMKNAPLHRFVVFSTVDDDKPVIKFAQCNNCGIIHKIVDIGRSEILKDREHMSSIISVSEIKLSLNPSLVSILDANFCDLPTYEMVKFIIDQKKWGEIVILSSEEESGTRQGKYVRIMGEALFNVDSFTREEFITNG